MEYYKFKDVLDFHVWDIESYGSIDSKNRFQNSWMSKYIGPNSKVIDIGCGPGYNVKVLKDNGIDVIGVDLNEQAVAKAKLEGLPVIHADALTYLEENRHSFDIFIMSDFVEHVPLEVVYRILSILTDCKGATIFFCTPNLDSLMGFKFWFHMPTHINAMHPYVIRKMIAKLGYTIEKEWTEYGNLPGKGWKLWIRTKIVRMLFGTQAELFMGGANINFIIMK